MYLRFGRIVYDCELVTHRPVEYIEYVKQESPYYLFTNNLPTLYVGWEFFKKTNPNNILIQNQAINNKIVIENKLYWEFEYSEIKAEHVDGVENFVVNAPLYYLKDNYKYVNVDPVFCNLYNFDDLKNYLPKSIDYVYIYDNEQMYVLSNNVVYCVNLRVFNFFKFDIESIKMYISSISAALCDDVHGDKYVKLGKIYPQINDLKRFIAIILNNNDDIFDVI